MSERAVAAKATSAGLRSWRRAIQVAGAAAVLGQWSLYGVLRSPVYRALRELQNCPVITCQAVFLEVLGILAAVAAFRPVGRPGFLGWAAAGRAGVQLLGKVAPLGRDTAASWRARPTGASTWPWPPVCTSITP